MEFPCRAFLCACGGRYSPPPHAWGILPYLASRYVRGRFIPTCVGNTSSAYPDSTATAVHPHVRGEYILPRFHRHGDIGSSPRARGIPSVIAPNGSIRRFIPTCVGNTFRQFRRSGGESVHPHVRGEYSRAALRQSAHNGSSPRAWGILGTTGTDGLLDRFIPTCVGNTAGRRCGNRRTTVHPHVRGEYLGPPERMACWIGSSPRAWGILPFRPPRPGQSRFIPTCVGNTSIPSSPARPEPVHPHVRGEYITQPVRQPGLHGSSPRAWGILHGQVLDLVGIRFIPTCVGNTMTYIFQDSLSSVHPHVRGEYVTAFSAAPTPFGSSPRAWGILPPEYQYSLHFRFIPTCVGNTLLWRGTI